MGVGDGVGGGGRSGEMAVGWKEVRRVRGVKRTSAHAERVFLVIYSFVK